MIDGHAHPFDLQLQELELSRVAIDVAELGAGGDGSALLWRSLVRVLGLAPLERVLAGTDAWGPPEAFWVAATILRQAWDKVQADHAALGVPHAWLRDATDAVMKDNARRLYRLNGSG